LKKILGPNFIVGELLPQVYQSCKTLRRSDFYSALIIPLKTYINY